jgi:hypothetical protein
MLILNNIKEVRGALYQNWDPNLALEGIGTGFLEYYNKDFNPANFVIINTEIGAKITHDLVLQIPKRKLLYKKALSNSEKLWLLDPDNFK